MDVDLYQLPIPRWDIPCPQCGYSTNGLPSHRCPECGTSFDMAEVTPSWARVREPAYSGWELPLPDFGLYCSACDATLAGATEHTCPACGAPFDPLANRPDERWFDARSLLPDAAAIRAVAQVLQAEYVPYMLREDFNALGYAHYALLVASEFYFDFLHVVRCGHLLGPDETDAPSSETDSDAASWTCSQCGQDNPPNFGICWQCQTEKPG